MDCCSGRLFPGARCHFDSNPSHHLASLARVSLVRLHLLSCHNISLLNGLFCIQNDPSVYVTYKRIGRTNWDVAPCTHTAYLVACNSITFYTRSHTPEIAANTYTHSLEQRTHIALNHKFFHAATVAVSVVLRSSSSSSSSDFYGSRRRPMSVRIFVVVAFASLILLLFVIDFFSLSVFSWTVEFIFRFIRFSCEPCEWTFNGQNCMWAFFFMLWRANV